MEQKHQVHNLIILDESGSMEPIKRYIMQGFNEVVQTVQGVATQYPEQEHYISMVSFNGLGQKILHLIDPVEKLKKIDDKRYNPGASTPLYDAIGFACGKLKQLIPEGVKHNVLVTILTDGEENASKEYTRENIKKIIDDLKDKGWTFTYIGTDHNVENVAFNLSISNTMVFSKSRSGVSEMFSKERAAREGYSRKIRNSEDVKYNFYDDEL